MQRSDGELMQHWVEKYRELARECLRVASTTITAESRSLLVEMARVWTRLADEQNIRAQQPKGSVQEGSRERGIQRKG